MADNNSILTIVLVVAAVLLFTGNLTGNQVRAPPGSQVAAWCPSSTGKLLADGEYVAYAVENSNVIIERCVNGQLTKELCPDTGVLPNRIGVNRQYSTDPIATGCVPFSISNTIQSPSAIY